MEILDRIRKLKTDAHIHLLGAASFTRHSPADRELEAQGFLRYDEESKTLGPNDPDFTNGRQCLMKNPLPGYSAR